ncbi:MAG: hypothetical protein SFV15_19840 [Polyangiaceae bacterium]|nr:hypothetical protein [Polyangiaceae bacterium]
MVRFHRGLCSNTPPKQPLDVQRSRFASCAWTSAAAIKLARIGVCHTHIRSRRGAPRWPTSEALQQPTPLNFWGVGTDNRNQPEGTGDWTNADDDPKGAAQPVEEKKWLCLEWLGDYTTDETKFFLDGVEHPSLATTPATQHGGNADKPFLLPEFNAIWFGWAEYQDTTQKFELWFDEITIDKELIGCVL